MSINYDNDDTTINFTLTSFCARAIALLRTADGEEAFVKFVLGGLDNGRRVIVDPVVNGIGDQDSLLVRRDYDSLLGIDKRIRVKSSMTVYPLAKKEDTLTANIHLTYTFMNSRGHFTAPVHKIPNLCIGLWGTRNMVRVLLPELYVENRSSPRLSQEEQTTFYEKGLLPTMQYLDPDQATQWPASYNDEMFRARGRNGQLSFQTKVVGDWLIDEFGDALRQFLDYFGCSWGTGLVFLHQIRGVKHSSQHTPNRLSAHESLIEFLRQNQLLNADEHDIGAITSSEGSKWWIDVGLEIASDEQRCLAWRTDSHPAIVKTAFGLDARNAKRITSQGSSQYTRDMASHLPAVSGCRITPGTNGAGNFGVKYFQLYTTDKALIYRPDQGHHGKFIDPIDIIKDKGVAYADKLYNLYRNAIKDKYSLARLEVRIPIEQGSEALLNISRSLLYDSLLSFNKTVWWSLRAYRCLAIKHLLEWQQSGDTRNRAHPDALLLSVACSWTLNGIHSTPDTGASYKELINAILPRVHRASANPDILLFGTPTADDDIAMDEELDDDNHPGYPHNTAPAMPYGLLFFRALRFGPQHPVPRFRHDDNAFISVKAFKHFFGCTPADMDRELLRSTRIAKVHPARIQNKTRRTIAYANWGQDTEANVFDLSRRGYRLTSPARDEGSDVAASDDENESEEQDIDKILTNTWRQFLLDLTSKAPNPKKSSKPSYVVLTQAERTSVNEKTYQNTRLSAYFRDCQWKIASNDEWNMVFRRLWPDAGDLLPAKSQNYDNTLYFPKWHSIMENADRATVKRMRKALKARFDELYWIPFAQTDRIWRTSSHLSFKKSSGLPSKDAAPQIFIHPNGFEPDW